MKQKTRFITAGRDPATNPDPLGRHGVVNPPVYHASTIVYPSLAEFRALPERRQRDEQQTFYGRVYHPTTLALERAVADIEGGYRSFAFPSGLAAIAAALQAFLSTGDHVLIADSTYFPTRKFADGVLGRLGVAVTYYDPTIGAGIAELMRPETRVVFAESPGSLTFELQDIPAIAAAAHAGGAVLMADNTWATALYFRPFEHGVDVSIQAGTKYIVGHSDAMVGLVITTREAWPPLSEFGHLAGQCLGPDDAYLALRGLRTLGARLPRHYANGLAVAEWLMARPEVDRVLHPALKHHPGHDLWRRDFSGASGLFSVVLKACPEAALAAFIDGLEYFALGGSWGGYESLVLPADPAKIRTATTWQAAGQLVRFHIGLEDPRDLIDDLAAGFDRLRALAR